VISNQFKENPFSSTYCLSIGAKTEKC